ncbi:MAG TPA: IS66 family transposase [Deltaproteobacteria bacterium]|nr:IS66 family transposase [Deltaproteobacteria bacterium]
MSKTTPAELPDSVEELRALLLLQQSEHAQLRDEHTELRAILDEYEAQGETLRATLDEYKVENERLAEAVRLLKSRRFGRSSERSPSTQLGIWNEAEAVVDLEGADVGSGGAEDEEDTIEVPAHTRRKQGRGGRKPLPDHLPRVEIRRDLEDHEKVCPNDPTHALTRIGEERAERLIYEPAKLYVEVEIRDKYACGTCKDGVACREPSAQPIPKSMASSSLLAQVATAKYVDGLPLARQEKILARLGIDLPRATLASWMIRCGELVAPLTDRLLEQIRGGAYVLADETPFQVLKEEGRRAASQSYLWALRLEDPQHPLLYYEYAPSRSGDVAERLLEGFTGYLQTDGYGGYDRFDDPKSEEWSKVVHVGCFVHARRKFDEALRGQGGGKAKGPNKKSTKSRVAQQGLSRIDKLFKVERKYRDLSPEDRYRRRQEELAPLIEELREWTTGALGRVPPTTLAGKAVAYLDRQWPKLERVLEDGRLELSTNAIERAIRPFVVGRKAWLFADTPSGATASARLYSLVETARANGVEPWRYLQTIFARLPEATSRGDYEALLPSNLADELSRIDLR